MVKAPSTHFWWASEAALTQSAQRCFFQTHPKDTAPAAAFLLAEAVLAKHTRVDLFSAEMPLGCFPT